MTLIYTRNPPVYQFTQRIKDEELAGLVPVETELEYEGERETVWEIEIPKARKAVGFLMHVLDMPYDTRSHIEKRAFSEEEKRILMPYAMVLCCLKGNMFGDKFIEHCLDDAWATIKANHSGISDEDIFDMLAGYLARAKKPRQTG